MWLRLKPKHFFVDGNRKLVNCWTICNKRVGDYVEKLYLLHFSQIVVQEVINQFTLLFDPAL
jgi:site-specific DNA-adenine methylase